MVRRLLAGGIVLVGLVGAGCQAIGITRGEEAPATPTVATLVAGDSIGARVFANDVRLALAGHRTEPAVANVPESNEH